MTKCPNCKASFTKPEPWPGTPGVCPICRYALPSYAPAASKRPGRGSQKAVKRRATLVKRDGVLCWICGRFMPEEDRTFDHVIPRSKGGTGALTNLRLAHKRCNSKRGDKDPPNVTHHSAR